jgi:hypothetical protein
MLAWSLFQAPLIDVRAEQPLPFGAQVSPWNLDITGAISKEQEYPGSPYSSLESAS